MHLHKAPKAIPITHNISFINQLIHASSFMHPCAHAFTRALEAPIDFILHGVDPGGEEIGLELIPNWLWRVVRLSAKEYKGGQVRNRLYFLGAQTQDESILDCTQPACNMQHVSCNLCGCVHLWFCGIHVLEPSVVYGVLSKSVRDMGGLAASVSLAVSVKYVRVGAGMEPHEVGSQRPG
jgi:hypothetical protein